MNTIDDRALDSMSVAPAETPAATDAGDRKSGDAGADTTIDERLHDDPEDSDARLDAGLDESMDASDPPSSVQPVHSTEPAPSSGYDAEAEKRRRDA